MSVAVLTPCFGGMVTAAYANSLLILKTACEGQDVKLAIKMHAGDGLITRARAELVAWFLETSCTHFVFIDADIGFEPGQFFRLLDFGADFVCAAYPIKRVDYEKVGRMAAAGRLPLEETSQTYVIGWHDPSNIQVKRGFGRVRYAGGGFTMIKRSAVEKLCAAHPELQYRSTHARGMNAEDQALQNRFALFDPMIDKDTGEYLPEDFAFSRRWTDLGGEIWVDMESRLDHYGPSNFRGNLSSQFVRTGE